MVVHRRLMPSQKCSYDDASQHRRISAPASGSGSGQIEGWATSLLRPSARARQEAARRGDATIPPAMRAAMPPTQSTIPNFRFLNFLAYRGNKATVGWNRSFGPILVTPQRLSGARGGGARSQRREAVQDGGIWICSGTNSPPTGYPRLLPGRE